MGGGRRADGALCCRIRKAQPRGGLVPLVLGSGVNILLLALHAHAAGELCAAFWKLAVGVLTVGCLLQGALEIYGTANRLMVAYPVSGAILISLAALCYLMRK